MPTMLSNQHLGGILLHQHGALLRALNLARAATSTSDFPVAALSELGDIDLPPAETGATNQDALQAAGPLYFSSELELSGILPTAELVCNLFVSGAITQPLGPTAQLLHEFWRQRSQRLTNNERSAIFARAFEHPYFDRLMHSLCEGIVSQVDGSDIREDVQLSVHAQAASEFLSQRVDAMAEIAAREIVDNINSGLVFLRNRMLQMAFGVNSLWALVSVANHESGSTAASALQHADRGRSGQGVLLWLSRHASDHSRRLDPSAANDMDVIADAQLWLELYTSIDDREAPHPATMATPATAFA